ncbi:hypothetical protein BAUCODRAFT_33729 [Baudoinia panamericana UAMH 10762]|uniref:Copper acquisition factor BIM1-like domain-containing protein n=1 Tax=Baudoinia panamericana (strain UAMH 10762) TaxID=717646 RepID=M2LPS0_BAUPA|nr:uncharacterized protein BAUCODRAFT_33729 [Baudoinia panamericana UAMH 10762]EMC96402.1 hypothetical protein BAUCODRAFT_33729 [Baudoinia panamericana UAMH 10762]
MVFIPALLIFFASLAAAHFDLVYPHSRGDPFAAPASEYIYPCTGYNATNNRTVWPTTGGSLVVHFHHTFTYVWINLGLGNQTTAFTISLMPEGAGVLPYNETGNGTICLPKVTIPAGSGVVDGGNGSLQVITVGDGGTALYNCADLTFSSSASLLTAGQGDCVNSTGVSMRLLSQQTNGTSAVPSIAQSTSTSSASASAGSATSAGEKAVQLSSSYFSVGIASIFMALGAVSGL